MKRFKNILYLNQSDANQATAFERAIRLAETNSAELTILEVIPDHADDETRSECSTHIDTLCAPYRQRGELR